MLLFCAPSRSERVGGSLEQMKLGSPTELGSRRVSGAMSNWLAAHPIFGSEWAQLERPG